MKSVKSKLAKNLKSIKPNAYLKQDRVLRVLAAADGLIEFIPKITYSISQTKPELVRKQAYSEQESDEEKSEKIPCGGTVQDADIINVPELIRDLEIEEEEEEEEEEETSGMYFGDKENVKPPRNAQDLYSRGENVKEMPEKSETGNYLCKPSTFPVTNGSEFRRPDLNSSSLFDPNLLAAFEQAVKEYIRTREAEIKARAEQRKIERTKDEMIDEHVNLETEHEKAAELEERRFQESEPNQVYYNPLSDFEERCPPGGEGSIVLYTTTLRGIRKTFDDCNKIRFLLDNLGVLYYERDVSMHRVYRDELWRTMEGKADLPVLFIRGKCVGGAQEVLGLHEQGRFRILLENQQVLRPGDCGCETCDGVRFVICFNCSGSHKVRLDNGMRSECLVCNENGLIVCPFCG